MFICKVLRTVGFSILTKLNESEPKNAHNYKPKKVAYFSWLSITKASTSDQTPFVAIFSIKENGQIKVTVVVKQTEKVFLKVACLFSVHLWTWLCFYCKATHSSKSPENRVVAHHALYQRDSSVLWYVLSLRRWGISAFEGNYHWLAWTWFFSSTSQHWRKLLGPSFRFLRIRGEWVHVGRGGGGGSHMEVLASHWNDKTGYFSPFLFNGLAKTIAVCILHYDLANCLLNW